MASLIQGGRICGFRAKNLLGGLFQHADSGQPGRARRTRCCTAYASLLRAGLKAGRLVQLFNVIARNGTSLWLVYPEERENSRKIRAFKEWLLDEIQRAR